MNKFGTDPSSYAIVTNNTILPIAGAAAGLTAPSATRIVCGSAAANLDIVLTANGSTGTTPTPTRATESNASDGTLTLTIPVTPTNTADLTKAVKVFVAARFDIMGTTFTLFNNAGTWKAPVFPNPDLYLFSEITSLAATQNITVPTEVTKSALTQYGVEIYVGYKTTSGTTITNLGKVWP
jgi:hypothetical protein